jgi:hypothetical protein
MNEIKTYKVEKTKVFIQASDKVMRLSVSPESGYVSVFQEKENGTFTHNVTHYNIDCGLKLASNTDLPLMRVRGRVF